MQNRHNVPWWYLATLLAANLALLLPNANPLRVTGALILIGLLPGLSWANRFLVDSPALLRWVAAAALSYTITSLTTLLLHYLPGPVYIWQLLVALNAFAILPTVFTSRGAGVQGSRGAIAVAPAPPHPCPPAPMHPCTPAPLHAIPLLLIFAIAIFLRTTNLHYSEFQGDEALAMIAAAEALEGHEDALFLRSKGPGEVLLPMALWRLTGTINESIARLPFTLAALLAIPTMYLIGQAIAGQRAGWLAAGFFAFNGFMVAFGRIVQYQAFVVWFSALAFLMAIQWQATRRRRFAILGGLCLGTGLLAHYDAILALPAILWLCIPSGIVELRPNMRSIKLALNSLVTPSKTILLFLAAFLLASLPFYLPYSLDPQANRTGDYVGARIGNELRNNLPDFFHFNTFYSSSYYIIITSLLVLGFLAWLFWQARWSHWILPILAVAIILAIVVNPNLLAGPEDTLNLTIIPFALLLLGAFLALPAASTWQALIAWLAVPFLGYNFVVALGLTHIYTIVPAWSLLAALSWKQLTINNEQLTMSNLQSSVSNLQPFGHTQDKSPISNLIAYFVPVALLILSTIFLWNAFVRHDIEYWQDFPNGNLLLFWNPYGELPKAGFFGFAHRSGWKAVGQKITDGEFTGDYGSNEEPDVTAWYTRGAPRACDPHPEFYFLADDLIDPIAVPNDVIDSRYEKIGAVTLPNQKQMQIMQQVPSSLALGTVDEAALARRFDWTATPAAFARSARGSLPVEANFGNLALLIGYDLDTRRAYPGGRVPVTLYWQALTQIPTSYQVFTHLESESGPIAQSDGAPVCWTYPTDAWRPGQIIADQHAISLSSDTPPGEYPLEIGLYLPDTFERLDVLDEAGNPAGTSVTLTVVEIGD